MLVSQEHRQEGQGEGRKDGWSHKHVGMGRWRERESSGVLGQEEGVQEDGEGVHELGRDGGWKTEGCVQGQRHTGAQRSSPGDAQLV